MLVASTGGHLDQLWRLHQRFRPHLLEVEWATFDTPQSRYLLAGETVTYLPFVRPKDLRGALANVPFALRLLRGRDFSRVISTGAAVAVPFFTQARLLRLASHYIESAARSNGPSLTGGIIAKLPGVRLYGQYPMWTAGRWQYRGTVFDGFSPAISGTEKSADRVVVTFGTQRNFGFRRAAESLAKLLPEVCSNDVTILWQTGSTDVTGLGIDGVEAMDAGELGQAISEADLVISHAGVGSALQALELGKCPVLLPRRRQFGEHTDDHQRMIAEELSSRGLAVSVDPSDLTANDLLRAATMGTEPTKQPPNFILQPD